MLFKAHKYTSMILSLIEREEKERIDMERKINEERIYKEMIENAAVKQKDRDIEIEERERMRVGISSSGGGDKSMGLVIYLYIYMYIQCVSLSWCNVVGRLFGVLLF